MCQFLQCGYCIEHLGGCVLIVSLCVVQNSHGVLVPGGFGDRGVQGKILAATYARTNGVPYLGICLGMQLAVVEYARNVGAHILMCVTFDVNRTC